MPPTTCYVGRVVDAPHGLGAPLRWASAVVVDDATGRIVDVARDDNIVNTATHKVVELPERAFLVPGFVDAHVHASQYPFAGTGIDRPLMAEDGFLAKHAFPTESMFADAGRARVWYDAFVDEMIRQGTTCAVVYATQHRAGCDALVDAALARGAPRCLVGKVSMDRLCPDAETLEASLADQEAFIDRTRGLDKTGDLVAPIITPRFLPTCTPELLKGLGEVAAKYDGVFVQTHLSETIDEVDFSKSLFPDFPHDAAALDAFGLLRDGAILAHCVHMLPGEIELLKARNATIAHCPSSNFYFAKEALPVKQLVQRHGLRVALATDLAGGYSPSMLCAMRYAVLASKTLQFRRHAASTFFAATKDKDDGMTEDALREAHDLTHFDALHLATQAGADAVGRGSSLGSFDVGKQFDAVLLDADAANVRRFEGGTAEAPEDVLQKILCLGDDRNVARVYVNGGQVK